MDVVACPALCRVPGRPKAARERLFSLVASVDGIAGPPALASLGALGRQELLFLLDQVSRAGVRDPKIWGSYAARAQAEIASCTAEELCAMLRALCRARFAKRSLLNAACKRLRNEAATLPARLLAQLVSDLRQLGHLDGPLLLALVGGGVARRLGEFDALDLSLLLCAFARASVRDEPRINAVGRELVARRADLTPSSVGMALYALALLDSTGGGAAASLAAAPARRCLSGATRSEAVNLAFALVASDLPEAGLLSFVLERLARQRSELEPRELHAMCIVEHCVRLPEALRPVMRQSMTDDPAAAQRCNAALKMIVETSGGLEVPFAVTSSKLQRRLERHFNRLHLPHQAEGAVGPYMLDYVLPLKVAVEVDGFTHFYAFSRRYTAKSLLKLRVLRAMGWSVVSVPHFEWLPRRDDARLSFLATSIEEASGSPLSALRKSGEEEDLKRFARSKSSSRVLVAARLRGGSPHARGMAPARGSQATRR